MRKRLDDLFSALMPLAAIAVVLAGWWALTLPIVRAEDPVPPSVGQAPVHIEIPTPTPEPMPMPMPDLYNPAIPLSAELQRVLYEACGEADVPVALVLGVIQVESGFEPDAVSPEGCYGLMQLNPKYFPDKLSPADNLRAGIEYLGELLERYGDTAAALTAYNAGWDTGRRAYADAVLEAAEWWTELEQRMGGKQ